MAYNNRNKLEKSVKITDIYLKYKPLGYSNEYIYKNYIYPEFYISRSTFYNCLTIPAKRLLKEK